MINFEENGAITYEEFKSFCDKAAVLFNEVWPEDKFYTESLSNLDCLKEASYFTMSPIGKINDKLFKIDTFEFYTLDELTDFVKQNSKNMILMACHKLVVLEDFKFVIFCCVD